VLVHTASRGESRHGKPLCVELLQLTCKLLNSALRAVRLITDM
jgi:hypothetical protein